MKIDLEKLIDRINYKKWVGWLAIITIAFVVFLFLVCAGFRLKFDSEIPYSQILSGFGTLIISIFAAFFSGVNVLAFFFLTMAVEKQNTKREEKIFKIEAMKYKLENQKEIFDKITAIKLQFYLNERVKKIQESTEAIFFDNLALTISQEYESLQILAQCDTLFPSLSSDSIQKIMKIYREGINKQQLASATFIKDLADGYDEEDFLKYKSSIEYFWRTHSPILSLHLQLLIEQMQYDKLVALAQSLDQHSDFQPEWQKTANAIKAIEDISMVLDKHLNDIDNPQTTHTMPISNIYNWDFSTIENDDEIQVAAKEDTTEKSVKKSRKQKKENTNKE